MNDKWTFVSESVEQTEAIAADLARSFVGGEIVALHGELGAGKTQFVRGMLRGLGGEPRSVSSPTFVLLNVYGSGRLTLYHLDAYRIVGSEDFEAIGFGEMLEQGGGGCGGMAAAGIEPASTGYPACAPHGDG